MKKKIGELTLYECKEICKKQAEHQGSCKGCSLYNHCGYFSHLWSAKPTLESEIEIDD